MASVVILLMGVLLVGCGGQGPGAQLPAKHFVEEVRHAESADPAGGLELTEEQIGVDSVKAVTREDVPEFRVAERESRINQQPCARCHEKPLRELVARQVGEPKKSHWQIEMKHAGEQTMSCGTCHGGKQMGELVTLRGDPVSWNQAQIVCGQCHSKQASDWAGGAHGKRLGGWAPPRVVEACTGCHNPHAPRLESRWPARTYQGRTR